MYYFVDWKQTGEGYVPALPEGTSYCLVAEPAAAHTYGIFDARVDEDEYPALKQQRVSQGLSDLLMAAEQYAPALAVARERVRKIECASRELFVEAFAALIRQLLAAQRESPYFMAMAIRDEVGYKSAGTYYWIVGYRPDRVGMEVAWVARDFIIYCDAMSDFDCDKELLEERFLGRL